jgi:hypothetical protein
MDIVVLRNWDIAWLAIHLESSSEQVTQKIDDRRMQT